MKLIIAIINDDDSSVVSTELTGHGFFVTKISSTGGFLKRGNTTFLLGVEDEKVNECLGIIKENAHKRTVKAPVMPCEAVGDFVTATPIMFDGNVGGATVFVLPIESLIKF